MSWTKTCILLLGILSIGIARQVFDSNVKGTVVVDVMEDMKEEEGWGGVCNWENYAVDWRDFNCTNAGIIEIPEEDQIPGKGYWAPCAYHKECFFKYRVDHAKNFTQMAVEMYQREQYVHICLTDNGGPMRCTPYYEQGWQNFTVDISSPELANVTIFLKHFTPKIFTLVDKFYLFRSE